MKRFQVAPDKGSSKHTLPINNQALGAFRGGSLPNVSAGAPTVKTATQTNNSSKVIDCFHPVLFDYFLVVALSLII